MQAKDIEQLAREIAERRSINRRTVLKGGAATAAAAWMSGSAPLRAQSGGSFDHKTFLLDRIQFGRDEESSSKYDLVGGYTPFLELQLDPGDPYHDDGDAQIAAISPQQDKLYGQDPADIFWDPDYYGSPCAPPFLPKANTIIGLSAQTVLTKSHFSTRQLQWVMAEFWQDHMLTTFLGQPQAHFLWLPSFRDALLANALGTYEELLTASAQSGSMLWYLNLYQNTKLQPDENYARELLELYTVGLKNYLNLPPHDPLNPPAPGEVFTQTDVEETARLLTGWGIDTFPGSGSFCPTDINYPPNKNPNFGKFKFVLGNHDTSGTKRILGVDYLDTSGTEADGELFLTHLSKKVNHPVAVLSSAHTALHVTARMIQWFIGDDFSGQLFNVWVRTATEFFNSGGRITDTLRELFREDKIAELRPRPYLKMRRPLNLVLSLMRALRPDFLPGAAGQDINGNWIVQLYQMGQAPGYRAAPNGYPAENKDWQGSLLGRERFIRAAISDSSDAGLDVTDAKLDSIFNGIASTSYVDHVNQTLMGGILPAAEVAALQQYVSAVHPQISIDSRREALIAAFSSPSFQYLY